MAATSGSQSAASLELATGGDPVMAIGGFDNEGGQLTLAQFERYVKAGDIHYYIVSSGGPGGGGTGGFGGGSAATGRSATPGRVGTRSGSGGFPGAAGGSTSGSGGFGGGPGGSGGLPGTGGGAGGSSTSSITSWVEAHFTKETIGGVTVYDLTKSSKSTLTATAAR